VIGLWLSGSAPLAAQQELPLACPASRSARGATAGNEPAQAAAVVVLLELGPELSCALVTALGPWGLRVVASAAPNPGPSMPSSALAAQQVAQARGARAVVWLARDAQGFALWVYDARSDRSLARPAPSPPLDASAAAALALSVKTVLRLVGLAPSASAAEPPSPPRDAASVPPPPDTTTAVTPSATGTTRAVAAWQVGVDAGVRFGPLGVGPPDARYGAEVRWSPWASAGGPTQSWLGLRFESGAPHRIRGERLEGQLWDSAPALALGVRHELAPALALGLSGVAALHVTSLSGVARELDVAVDDTHLNPTLGAAAELSVRLGRPALALQPAAELWLRGQRYLVDTAPVLETRRISGRLTLALQLPLD
jgi:hypothetical protein